MANMEWLRLDLIAGKGKEALYSVYINGKRAFDAVTMPEILEWLQSVGETDNE